LSFFPGVGRAAWFRLEGSRFFEKHAVETFEGGTELLEQLLAVRAAIRPAAGRKGGGLGTRASSTCGFALLDSFVSRWGRSGFGGIC
jgi:hypothetical protein